MTSPVDLAAKLANSTARFIDDRKLKHAGRNYGLDFDDARRAAIIADRLRRQQQLDESRPGLRITNLVDPAAPISLPAIAKGKRR